MFSKNADLFFEEPHCHREPPATYGILHLLRRDIIQCLGKDPSSGKDLAFPALWPGAMAILAGIDLLAKYHAGSDEVGGVGRRFRDFIKEYFTLPTQGDDEVIYQLRNALLHSFGLYSRSKTGVYRFEMTLGGSPVVTRRRDDRYVIDLFALHREFEDAIARYRKDLEGNMILKANFDRMFSNYGSVSYTGRTS